MPVDGRRAVAAGGEPCESMPGHMWCVRCCNFVLNKRLSSHNSICDGITRQSAASTSSSASAEVPDAPLPDERSSPPPRLPLHDGSAPCRRRSLDPRQRHMALLEQLRSEPKAKASLRDLQFLKLASRGALSERAVNDLLRDEHRVRRPASNKHSPHTRTHRISDAECVVHVPCTQLNRRPQIPLNLRNVSDMERLCNDVLATKGLRMKPRATRTASGRRVATVLPPCCRRSPLAPLRLHLPPRRCCTGAQEVPKPVNTSSGRHRFGSIFTGEWYAKAMEALPAGTSLRPFSLFWWWQHGALAEPPSPHSQPKAPPTHPPPSQDSQRIMLCDGGGAATPLRRRRPRGVYGLEAFCASETVHETAPTTHGHVVVLSTGWELAVVGAMRARARWGMPPLVPP